MEKTDWNDVHKISGLSAIKEQLGLINKDPKTHEIAKNFNQDKSILKDNYTAIYDRTMAHSNKENMLLNRMDQQKSHSTYSTIESNMKIKTHEVSPPSIKIERNQKALDLEL